MFKSIFWKIFRSEPARFVSAYPLEKAVRLLTDAIESNIFSIFFRQSVYGSVSKDRVKLQRIIPFVGNSFKPVFYGEFVGQPRGVELIGRFTVMRFAKIFMTVWLSF